MVTKNHSWMEMVVVQMQKTEENNNDTIQGAKTRETWNKTQFTSPRSRRRAIITITRRPCRWMRRINRRWCLRRCHSHSWGRSRRQKLKMMRSHSSRCWLCNLIVETHGKLMKMRIRMLIKIAWTKWTLKSLSVNSGWRNWQNSPMIRWWWRVQVQRRFLLLSESNVFREVEFGFVASETQWSLIVGSGCVLSGFKCS